LDQFQTSAESRFRRSPFFISFAEIGLTQLNANMFKSQAGNSGSHSMNSLAMAEVLRRPQEAWRARVVVSLFAFSFAQGAWAQDEVVSGVLQSTAWCQESFTEISRHTVRLTFLPNGTLRYRKEMDLANGSNNATHHNANWTVRSNTLVIAEPNGAESRLPIVIRGSGRATQLTLGTASYAVCR
jgi:hypothetical protein